MKDFFKPSKNLIVVTFVYDNPRDCDVLCLNSIKRYSEKIGCDLSISTEMAADLPQCSQWQKFQIYRKAIDGNYDKVLLLDADIIVTPRAPDIFKRIKKGIAFALDGFYTNPKELYRKSKGELNSGVLLACKDSFNFFSLTNYRKEEVFKRASNWGRKKEDGTKGWADQDYFKEKVKDIPYFRTILSNLWNYQVYYNDFKDETRKKCKINRDKAYFIHYTKLKKYLVKHDYKHFFEKPKKPLLMFEDISTAIKLAKKKLLYGGVD